MFISSINSRLYTSSLLYLEWFFLWDSCISYSLTLCRSSCQMASSVRACPCSAGHCVWSRMPQWNKIKYIREIAGTRWSRFFLPLQWLLFFLLVKWAFGGFNRWLPISLQGKAKQNKTHYDLNFNSIILAAMLYGIISGKGWKQETR